MRALVKADGGVAVVERASPAMGRADHVRIEVLVGGVCRTDVFVARSGLGGPGPLVLGHEVGGRVLELGAGAAGLEVGDLVAVEPAFGCGGCASCAAGEPLRCPDRRMLGLDVDGAFAGQVVLPSARLHRLPRGLDPRRAAYAEPVAAALGAAEAPISTGERGIVLGDNRIARLTHLVLSALGFERLSLGAADGEGAYDFVVETSGAELEAALFAVRPGGRVVLKSRPPGPVPLPLERAVRKQVDLCARSYGPFARAVALVQTLELEPLFGRTYPLEAFEAAFADTLEAPVKTFLRLFDAG